MVSIALRAHDFGNPAITVDEQYYLLVGDRMLHGALPYVDLWDRKPIGLFLIYAATRMLPGGGIVAYQFAAAIFAGATAFLVASMGRLLGASRIGAGIAATIYLVWLHLFSGGGGQSPVFYNLFVAGAALLTLRLPRSLHMRTVFASGCGACILAGIAIQIKYSPVFEGSMFGLAHLWRLHRLGGRPMMLAGAATAWILCGLAPTLLALAVYSAHGSAALSAFWFANFQSIWLRGHYHYPIGIIAGRLAGIFAQLAPLLIAVAVKLWNDQGPTARLGTGWLAAACCGFVAIGTFFDDYALPLVLPLSVLAAAPLGNRLLLGLLALGAGLGDYGVRMSLTPDDAPGIRQVAAIVKSGSHTGCPYVFTGDVIVYYLADVCIPTRYAFPSTLAYAPEAGASGVDEAAEVARIMAGRPPMIVTGMRPLAAWNEASRRVFATALSRDYRPVLAVPREDYLIVVYRRNWSTAGLEATNHPL